MRLLKDKESGQVLIMVLILLALGSLLAVPTVRLAGTSVNYHRVVEENTLELYAADSGMQYALCKLAGSPGEFEPEPLPSGVNGKTVNITAEQVNGSKYRVVSTAISDNSSSTAIESYVTLASIYDYLFDNAITSPGDVTLQPDTEVNGDIQLNGDLDNKGDIVGEISDEPVIMPTVEEISAFYWFDVEDLTPLPDGYTIDISSGTEADPYPIGPLYASGNLTITGSGVARIDGTIYVAGNLSFNPTPSMTILLNMQTIFAKGSISLNPGVTISGSGCIIAVGSLNFQPDISGEDFVFLMSVEGTVDLQPGNSFYGSVAGDVEVELSPGTTLQWTSLSEGMNFGGGGGIGGTVGDMDILTWHIS
ncbi:hypothetical protein ACFLVS_00290 [Chloroflexota bacterium]